MLSLIHPVAFVVTRSDLRNLQKRLRITSRTLFWRSRNIIIFNRISWESACKGGAELHARNRIRAFSTSFELLVYCETKDVRSKIYWNQSSISRLWLNLSSAAASLRRMKKVNLKCSTTSSKQAFFYSTINLHKLSVFEATLGRVVAALKAAHRL